MPSRLTNLKSIPFGVKVSPSLALNNLSIVSLFVSPGGTVNGLGTSWKCRTINARKVTASTDDERDRVWVRALVSTLIRMREMDVRLTFRESSSNTTYHPRINLIICHSSIWFRAIRLTPSSSGKGNKSIPMIIPQEPLGFESIRFRPVYR
jgi:hypothetical protein